MEELKRCMPYQTALLVNAGILFTIVIKQTSATTGSSSSSSAMFFHHHAWDMRTCHVRRTVLSILVARATRLKMSVTTWPKEKRSLWGRECLRRSFVLLCIVFCLKQFSFNFGHICRWDQCAVYILYSYTYRAVLFTSIFLIWTEVPFIQEVSGAYTSPFLDTDELNVALRARKVSGAFTFSDRSYCDLSFKKILRKNFFQKL